jgi:hypothetical protein
VSLGKTHSVPRVLAIPGYREARKARARDIWKSSGSASPQLGDTLMADVLELALDDFGEIYRSARGYTIDPTYLRALRNDILIALEAVARAERTPSSLTPASQDDARSASAREARAESKGPPPND